MGYTTDFEGKLKFNRQLTVDEKNFLDKLANTRRMARNVDRKYGVEGEFYVDGGGFMGQDHEDNVIDSNTPPRTQPGLWCQWVPTEDGKFLEWDGGEKFYAYVEWLQYIIDKVFPYITADGDEPLSLTGSITWQGEESEDMGRIQVNNNVVTVLEGNVVYNENKDEDTDVTRVFFVTDSDDDNEELHETLEAARDYADTMTYPRIRVCIVRNAYRESNGSWNYDDRSDTFETVKVITEE